MTDERVNEEVPAEPTPEEPSGSSSENEQEVDAFARVVGAPADGAAAGRKVAVEEDEELMALRRDYRPLDGAKVEFNIHDAGLSIAANREGWESLAEWCRIMAHPDLGEYSDPYELTADVFPAEMFIEGRALLSFWGIADSDNQWYQDVYFHRVPRIGEELWQGDPKSGNSPRTKVFMYQMLDRFKWLNDMRRLEVDAELGKVYFEGIGPDGRRTVVYKAADTPNEWIAVEFDEEDRVVGYGFSAPAPWEDDLTEVEIVLEFQGLD